MADLIGPCSTLPGHTTAPPSGTPCDEHPDRPAVSRVQGETDSFGAELLDLCAECVAEIRRHSAEDKSGRCDWCGHEADDLRNRRDYEEGPCGRVYRVCGQCVKRENARLDAEREDWDDYDADYPD